jgi:hypothetical protein
MADTKGNSSLGLPHSRVPAPKVKPVAKIPAPPATVLDPTDLPPAA